MIYTEVALRVSITALINKNTLIQSLSSQTRAQFLRTVSRVVSWRSAQSRWRLVLPAVLLA